MTITALVGLSTAHNSFPPPLVGTFTALADKSLQVLRPALVGTFTALANADLRAMNVSPPPLVGTFRTVGAIFQGDIDVHDGGKYKVFGTTKIVGFPADTPASMVVTLHDGLSGRVIRRQLSDSVTGVYQFSYIRNGDFYVAAFDPLKNYRAVIADQLVPEAM